MGAVLRNVSLPTRLETAPKPVDLRYLDKDAQGHTRISIGTSQRKAQDELASAPLPRSAPSPNPG